MPTSVINSRPGPAPGGLRIHMDAQHLGDLLAHGEHRVAGRPWAPGTPPRCPCRRAWHLGSRRAPAELLPLKRMRLSGWTMAFSGSRRTMLMALTLLPLPDSPPGLRWHGRYVKVHAFHGIHHGSYPCGGNSRSWTLIKWVMVLLLTVGVRAHYCASGLTRRQMPSGRPATAHAFCRIAPPARHVLRLTMSMGHPAPGNDRITSALMEAHHMQAQLHQHHVADVGQDVGEHARSVAGTDGLGRTHVLARAVLRCTRRAPSGRCRSSPPR